MASLEVYASIVHNGYNILWTASVLLGLPSREALANAETEEGEEGEEEEEAAADSVASSPSMVVGDFRPPKRKLALPEDEDRVDRVTVSLGQFFQLKVVSHSIVHGSASAFAVSSVYLAQPVASDSLCVEHMHLSLCLYSSTKLC